MTFSPRALAAARGTCAAAATVAPTPPLLMSLVPHVQRAPRPRETDRLLRFVRQQRDSQAAANETALWTGVARVLLNLDEFMTRE